MDAIKEFIENMDPTLLGILLTASLAFISWLVKNAIEAPINNSKEIFFKFFSNRIEILSEIKVSLVFISLSPNEIQFKEKLQHLLSKDGRTSYLDKTMLDDILEISVLPKTDVVKTLKVINEINTALYNSIKIVASEAEFYAKYHSTNPIKNIYNKAALIIYNATGIFLCTALIVGIVYVLLFCRWYAKLGAFLVFLIWVACDKFFIPYLKKRKAK